MGLEMESSDFFCTQCGNKSYSLFRKKSKQREPGHLKKLYCPTCMKEYNHVEIRPNSKYTYEDFLIEMEMKNFDSKGKRVLTWKQCESKYYQGAAAAYESEA